MTEELGVMEKLRVAAALKNSVILTPKLCSELLSVMKDIDAFEETFKAQKRSFYKSAAYLTALNFAMLIANVIIS